MYTNKRTINFQIARYAIVSYILFMLRV